MWFLERGLLCSALCYRWHCRMEIAASFSRITSLGCGGSCSLSRWRRAAQIADFCSSACTFHLVINNNTNMTPRIEGKRDKEALCKLKSHTKAQNPLANLAILLQDRNILHFKGGRQLISLYISSLIRFCLYWSFAAVNENTNSLIVPSVFIRTLKSIQI